MSPCVVTRQALTAAQGGADRRSAKNANRPMNQSREAHHSASPHPSPEGVYSPGRSETVHEATSDPSVTASLQPSGHQRPRPGRHDPSACRERGYGTHKPRGQGCAQLPLCDQPSIEPCWILHDQRSCSAGLLALGRRADPSHPIPIRMWSAPMAPDGVSPAFPLVSLLVEPPAGIEPATPSLPSMVGPFGRQRGTSLRSIELQVAGRIDEREMGCCEAVCGAAAGKSLARSPVRAGGQRITRQQRIVHGVVLSAVLAGQVGRVVQPVRS
jgi:hypothetical protein